MLCIVEFTKYTATEFKNFDAFKGLLKSSVFHYEGQYYVRGGHIQSFSFKLSFNLFKVNSLAYMYLVQFDLGLIYVYA